ncbi:monovalent cation/H(+) antiporter subunit G [Actinocrispum sp. NPDC049592]|uniref:monovalent cation/H(+) antiporter subunit G n=1 Tax=Actinocrispum sp. NPDC049592 TaxID=3154835 RepID=UPI00341A7982
MILLWIGVVIAVAAAIGAVVTKDFYRRLHFLTPVTSLAGPVIGLALAIVNGWSLTTLLILLTIVILGVTGPVLSAATGRVAAQRDELE